jgi:hypothetical protein
VSHYTENPRMVRVDFFKTNAFGRPTKWYLTEAVEFTPYDGVLIHDAFTQSLERHLEGRLRGMVAVCLEPYHEHSHPIVVVVE